MVAELQPSYHDDAGGSRTFVHLHLHTQYSIVDGLVKVPTLMDAVAAQGMPAVALSDAGNLFAMVKFYTRALRAGVKPIIGVELAVRSSAEDKTPSIMVLLCQNVQGYRNLTRLVTRAFMEGQRQGRPEVLREWLQQESCEGLIALSGGFEGELARVANAGDLDAMNQVAAHWRDVFPNRFYLQVSRTGRAEEAAWLEAAVK
ncbi:MAG: PHP domain-containing protein, partial [Pseudomonadota bacterium]